MIDGSARITAVDPDGSRFVNDVHAGDLWLFPGGHPHSIQGLGPDGCKFLLVFNQGDFDEFSTFLLSHWFKHTPKDVLAKNFQTTESMFANLPKEKLTSFKVRNLAPLRRNKLRPRKMSSRRTRSSSSALPRCRRASRTPLAKFAFKAGFNIALPIDKHLDFTMTPAEWILLYPNGDPRNDCNEKIGISFAFEFHSMKRGFAGQLR